MKGKVFKAAALLAAVVVVFSSVSCSNAGSPPAADTTTTAAAAPADTTTAAADTTAADTATAAVADNAGDDSGASGKVLRVSIGDVGAVFDPQYNSGADGSMYMAQMDEGLVYYADKGVITPGMAESYTVSDDELTYTFKIRQDAKWSDGKDVTADDFVYSFKRLVDPALASPNAFDLGRFFKNGDAVAHGTMPLEQLGVAAPDPKTLVVTLEEPCPYFEDILTGSVFFPVRSDVAKTDTEGKWSQNIDTLICNGPYKALKYDSESYLLLDRNPYYYDKSRQVPDQIEFKFVADENAALDAFQSDQLDFTLQIPSEEIKSLTAQGVYHQEPRLGTYYIEFNCTKAPYDNPLVRQALAYAVDPNYIASTIMNDRFMPAQAFIGPGFSGSTPGSDFFQQGGVLIDRSDPDANVKKAQQLLSDAGYPGGSGFPVLNYQYNSTVDNTSIAQALQGFWQDNLGITVNLSAVENNAMAELRKSGAFDVTRQGWLADYNDPLDMMNVFTQTSGINEGKYYNPKFDDLFVQAQRTGDRAARMDLLHQCEKILIDDMGCVPLLHYTFGMLYDPNKLTGVYTSPAGQLYFCTVQMN